MKVHAAKVAQCEHWSAAVLFIQELGMAQSRLGEMLRSKTTSDVVEALRFFVTASSTQGRDTNIWSWISTNNSKAFPSFLVSSS